MSVSRREFLRYASILAAGTAAAQLLTMPVLASEADPLLHVLNRLTWGPRPADYTTIQRMGLKEYIDWQLDYTNIPDPQVDEFLAARRILSLPINELNQAALDGYEHILRLALWSRVYLAIYSERQLYERMVEFWTDHFNIPIPDYLGERIVDVRDVIRPHALGRFRELLLASAQSPAMLHYLDNAASTAAHPNENYARELMELHTLGVEGGYNEVDVVEVARVLTGWTVGGQSQFSFDANLHDFGEKTILGHTFPAGRGIEEGLQLLDLLATHPSTARFISSKLCRRFVSDTPPVTLIDSAASVFIDTEGDLQAVMRHILTSNEFMTSAGQKFRRPLEFLVAALRALQGGLQIDNPDTLIYTLESMGHLPFYWNPPNGYPDAGAAWMNTNGLMHRWNTALQLGLAGDGYFSGAALNLDAVIPPAATIGDLVQTAAEHLLLRPLPQEDVDELVLLLVGSSDMNYAVSDDLRQKQLPVLVGLILASPHFQWS